MSWVVIQNTTYQYFTVINNLLKLHTYIYIYICVLNQQKELWQLMYLNCYHFCVVTQEDEGNSEVSMLQYIPRQYQIFRNWIICSLAEMATYYKAPKFQLFTVRNYDFPLFWLTFNPYFIRLQINLKPDQSNNWKVKTIKSKTLRASKNKSSIFSKWSLARILNPTITLEEEILINKSYIDERSTNVFTNFQNFSQTPWQKYRHSILYNFTVVEHKEERVIINIDNILSFIKEKLINGKFFPEISRFFHGKTFDTLSPDVCPSATNTFSGAHNSSIFDY